MRILLVEDDFSLQNGISFKCSKESYDVSRTDTKKMDAKSAGLSAAMIRKI